VKRVALFGSTGTIGRSTIQVIEHLGDSFKLSALVANRNVARLAEQARRLRPQFAVIVEESRLDALNQALAGTAVKALAGIEGMNLVAAARSTDIVLMGLAGTPGLQPTLTALKHRKRVAIATKEIIVGFGPVVMSAARRFGAEILPVDSELSAIHQCLEGHRHDDVARVILTASGGPFRESGDLTRITVAEALNHPTWQMGQKITVDSATLMNKGLEVIETARYFGLGPEQIDVLIHPQSIVHSLVEFRDGSLLAQLALPDMRLPIQYALTYPARIPALVHRTRLETMAGLSFLRPGFKRFPSLGLAYRALRQGGTKPCILNVANDVAVQAFLQGKLEFHRIPEIVARTMRAFPNLERPTLRQLLTVEARAREKAEELVNAECRMQSAEVKTTSDERRTTSDRPRIPSADYADDTDRRKRESAQSATSADGMRTDNA
jgi:1-deoxy-D-xylulose-5-phosphate reductoisomerase